MKRQHSFVKELLALYEPYSDTTKQLVAEELKQRRFNAYDGGQKWEKKLMQYS